MGLRGDGRRGRSRHDLWDLLGGGEIGADVIDAFDTGYVAVNEAVTDAVVDEVVARDSRPIVMVHDYHLYLVGAGVWARCPDAFTHHFVHIPWPQPDSWRALPARIREQLVGGLLANDVVAFHKAPANRSSERAWSQWAARRATSARSLAPPRDRTVRPSHLHRAQQVQLDHLGLPAPSCSPRARYRPLAHGRSGPPRVESVQMVRRAALALLTVLAVTAPALTLPAHAGGSHMLSADVTSVIFRGRTGLINPTGDCSLGRGFVRTCDRTSLTTEDAGQVTVVIFFDEVTSWSLRVLDAAGNVIAEDDGYVDPTAVFTASAGTSYTIEAWRTGGLSAPTSARFLGEMYFSPS